MTTRLSKSYRTPGETNSPGTFLLPRTDHNGANLGESCGVPSYRSSGDTGSPEWISKEAAFASRPRRFLRRRRKRRAVQDDGNHAPHHL